MSGRTISAAAAAAATARLTYSVLRARPPGGGANWERTNHRGEPITLLEGPAVALGGVAGSLVAGGSGRVRLAVAIAGAGAAAFGSYDDLAGNGAKRGFRGHLGALTKGELTTGAVKLAGIGATGLAAAIVAGRPAGSNARRPLGSAADVVINAGLIAGGANLLNLFDLRPGRAIKVALLAGGHAGTTIRVNGGAASAAPLAARRRALLPEDPRRAIDARGRGRERARRDARIAAAATVAAASGQNRSTPAAIIGLTAASEVVSFSQVIDRTRPLRWADSLGRR